MTNNDSYVRGSLRVVVGGDEYSPTEVASAIAEMLERCDEDFVAVEIEPLASDQYEANEALREMLDRRDS